MSGKFDEVKGKVESFCGMNPQYKINDVNKEAEAILIDGPNGALITISIENGKVKCSDEAFQEALANISKAKPPALQKNVIRSRPDTVQTTNAAQAIQVMQAGKDLTYSVQKKQAPNATMALMAASDARIDLEEIAGVNQDDLVSSTIRAKGRNGRYVDATVSMRKADFINLLAWKEVQEQEKLKNFILDDSDPLNIALPSGFPKIKPDAMVSVRINDEMGSHIEKRRAIVHIYITAMQQWIFQQRQCQTKAKRNAIIQALTSSGNPMEALDPEELADEERERQIVEEAKA